MELSYKLRQMKQADENFVYNSFLKSYRSSWSCRPLDAQKFTQYYHKALESILGANRCVVACDSSDEDTIIGWGVGNGTTLWYVYVKHVFRHLGIGMSIVNELCKGPISIAFPTASGLGLLSSIGKSISGVVIPPKI